ncbi:hypothetical protein GCM10010174_88740 [Kutzneria viridogrisea]|uniref:Uncharacterized protein n=1 Tax=Kutzneria viridogrisea TaxID=47990 RepID=A0ABR6BIV8_9PSEU|nr:hypothetical protein [Kutzneria viridogrisea]
MDLAQEDLAQAINGVTVGLTVMVTRTLAAREHRRQAGEDTAVLDELLAHRNAVVQAVHGLHGLVHGFGRGRWGSWERGLVDRGGGGVDVGLAGGPGLVPPPGQTRGMIAPGTARVPA